jgi:hypothetical protein
VNNEYRYDDGWPFNIRLDEDDERQADADDDEDVAIAAHINRKRRRIIIKHDRTQK